VKPSGTFTYTTRGECDLATAMALLGDLNRQGELHPLIISVEERPTVAGALASYAITDRLRFGPFSFRITYTADVLERTGDRIVTVAHQNPGTTVHNETRVAVEGTGVRVDVTVTLSAPRILFGYAFRTAEAAHRELGERIGATLTRLGQRSS
jgi:hypothetical protein